ncbi:ribbon-helix-helix domain-containing protein [Idiomarina aminovorans]|uniref:ribbon-helix-helix domain-containing protein n=1 Tax=Idiomarina aminovorans TaxID=2914829 RepID=UPI00200660EE|nr:CopG family transcriptional regulator [Idiomarina sp. ATCH4]MCK7459217.1 CopG family transcriptional regulator [Idiomarina sp. ATCH4]
MSRQSITLTEQNDRWLCQHVQEVGEYNSKSELVNDLIRRARRAEAINKKLESAEVSGFTEQSPEEMLHEFKANLAR